VFNVVLLVVFVVLMLFWLFGVGGYYAYAAPPASRPAAFGGVLVPWLCVAILGWIVFSTASHW
jgi:hypothetical protein